MWTSACLPYIDPSNDPTLTDQEVVIEWTWHQVNCITGTVSINLDELESTINRGVSSVWCVGASSTIPVWFDLESDWFTVPLRTHVRNLSRATSSWRLSFRQCSINPLQQTLIRCTEFKPTNQGFVGLNFELKQWFKGFHMLASHFSHWDSTSNPCLVRNKINHFHLPSTALNLYEQQINFLLFLLEFL